MSTNLLDRNKIRVGVLRGGPSSEYAVSLQTGANVLKHLPGKFVPVDILVSRDGEWHVGGRTESYPKVFSKVDVVWNALHGSYGEDGKVQQILRTFGVRFTGSNSFSSSLGMNKNVSKALFQYHDLKTPEYVVLHPKNNTLATLIDTFQSIPQPSVVKPISGGSSIALSFAGSFESFKNGVEKAFRHGGPVIVEEYIAGVEVMCGVIEGRDGQKLFSLHPIAPKQNERGILTYEDKLSGAHEDVCPAPLSLEVKDLVQKLALSVHKHFNLRHYSATDMIIHPTRGIYLLEVNSLPGLTEQSLLPKALKTANISMEDFIDHVLSLALENR